MNGSRASNQCANPLVAGVPPGDEGRDVEVGRIEQQLRVHRPLGDAELARPPAVAVAHKILMGSDAARAELKPHLPGIAETLQKAAEHTRDTRLATEIKTLQSKVRELQQR